jgi:hypothetical protein
MKEVTLTVFPNRFWHKADLNIKYDKSRSETIQINKFYDISPEWIYIYDTEGGTGTGFTKGNLIQKVFIGDAEFRTISNNE